MCSIRKCGERCGKIWRSDAMNSSESLDCPIIDGHTHLGLEAFIVKPIPEAKQQRPAFRDRMENRYEALIERLDCNQVDQAVAFPFPLEEVDTETANRYVLEASQAYPERIIPFVLIGDRIEYWLQQGARGVKQHFLMAPDRFDLSTAYRAIAEAGVPLIAHLTTREGPGIPAQIRAIRQMAPTLTLIVAHMGRRVPNTGEGVEEHLAELREMEQVYLETSTVREPQTIATAVEVLGDERIVYGSDFPFNSYLDADPMAVELETIRQAQLPSSSLARVLGGNLARCLGS
ncbi:amidohydrolase family protein [candidate division KSB3 bacterium]|uniref:Amidohydrolase family protein n=1 Tax=candidate division KSB3 bacterium TaxID=2044937 RepID=A0A9D5K190_9BACT|nr:amidohydrolase family protein [candidate division KSB3 bacterium]MBD3327596.1 amidohydrolase family protein [candidate division KSB3 bacterium]